MAWFKQHEKETHMVWQKVRKNRTKKHKISVLGSGLGGLVRRCLPHAQRPVNIIFHDRVGRLQKRLLVGVRLLHDK
jgi:hypothetical protein